MLCTVVPFNKYILHNLYCSSCTTMSTHKKLNQLHTFLCFYCACLFMFMLFPSLTRTAKDYALMSAAAELLHCRIAKVLPLQIRLLDNLSQLQYEGKWLTSIIYISQPPSLSSLVIPGAELCTRAQCPRRPSLNWLNSLSQDPCTSPSSHGEDTCSKQLLHIPDGRARQMSKENQRERQGKVYEPAFANLNEKLFIPSSKTGCSWRNSRPCPVWGSPGSSSPT